MIIDFECDSPTEAVKRETIRVLESGGGFAHRGYFNFFKDNFAAVLGMTPRELEVAQQEVGLKELSIRIVKNWLAYTLTDEQFIGLMDDAGVTKACIGTTGMWASVEDTRELAGKYQDRLFPFFRSSPHQGQSNADVFEQAVKEWGFKGLVVSGFRENLPTSHEKYYPFYHKCVELDVPARITTLIHFYTDRPMDLCHPRHLDKIAIDFPDLKIVAGLGGWPWVPDLVGVASRHKNVFIDLACHRPEDVKRPGSGFEMLLEHGNRKLQDQVIFASGWGTQGIPLKQVVEEFQVLAVNESIRRKWMYENAARVLKLG